MFEGMEISDGETISPHNQPCKVCTCNKGVITCDEPICDCSTWKKSNSRDLCCPQCDPMESCLHQELKHLVFRSGEQWIYQCQTCECLVSRIFPVLLRMYCSLILKHHANASCGWLQYTRNIYYGDGELWPKIICCLNIQPFHIQRILP